MMEKSEFFHRVRGYSKNAHLCTTLIFWTFGLIFRGWFMGLEGAENVEIPTFLGLLRLFFEDGFFLLYTLYTLLLE